MKTAKNTAQDARKDKPKRKTAGAAVVSIIAAACILVYIGAIAYGGIMIYLSTDERGSIAEQEFDRMADLAVAAAASFGFMSQSYQDAIRDAIVASRTIEGVIVSGSDVKSAFERSRGSVITWEGDDPRFMSVLGYSRNSFDRPLMIDGQRNVNIRAVYSVIDHDYFVDVLKKSLIIILGGLFLSFFSLIIDTALKSRAAAKAADRFKDSAADGDLFEIETLPAEAAGEKADSGPRQPEAIPVPPAPPSPAAPAAPAPPAAPAAGPESEASRERAEARSRGHHPATGPESEAPREEPAKEAPEEAPERDAGDRAAERGPVPPASGGGAPPGGEPRGLYSPRSQTGWESYTQDRLASELHRAASFEQDLVFIAMELKAPATAGDLAPAGAPAPLEAPVYRAFADETVKFFTQRDLVFERGDAGLSVVIPGVTLEQGFARAEEFRARLGEKLPAFFRRGGELFMGLCSRTGRLVDAARMLQEAQVALEKAMEEGASSLIVAFKSDPEKFRQFLLRQAEAEAAGER